MTINAAREHLKRAHDRIATAGLSEGPADIIGLAMLAKDDLGNAVKEAKEAAAAMAGYGKKAKEPKGQQGLPFTPKSKETHTVDESGNVFVDFRARAAGEGNEKEYRDAEARSEAEERHVEAKAEERHEEPLPV